MKKLQEENAKLQKRLSNWRKKYNTLQKKQDDYWAHKLSLSIGKIGLLLTAGVALGRFTK